MLLHREGTHDLSVLSGPCTGSACCKALSVLVHATGVQCGGEKAALAAAEPFLKLMGKNIVNCGQSGNGQAAKVSTCIPMHTILHPYTLSFTHTQYSTLSYTVASLTLLLMSNSLSNADRPSRLVCLMHAGLVCRCASVLIGQIVMQMPDSAR